MRQPPTSLAAIVDPATTAVVIWDMQVGIAPRAYNFAELLGRIGGLLHAARSHRIPVLWSRHVAPLPEHRAPVGLWSLMRRQGVTDVAEIRPFMQAGSPDVEFIPELTPGRHDLVFEKSTPSFFIGTPLELRLRASAVTTLILTGVATEQGIEFTARHALALGYFTVIAEDAVGSFSPEGHEAGLTYLRTAALVVPAADIVTAWRHSRP